MVSKNELKRKSVGDETITKKNKRVKEENTPSNEEIQGLEEGYVLAPSEKRFHFLLRFLEKNKKRKVIVLFSSCLSTKHHRDLLVSLDVPVLSIHGKQKGVKRTAIFTKFCSAPSGILLCAQAVTRDLELPAVDWILQYDPAEDTSDHIRRIRAAVSGENAKGKAVVILRPEEAGFLSYLKEIGVSTSEFKVSWNKVKNVQLDLEKLIATNYFLNLTAKEAYKAYLKAYDTHYLKEIFDIGTLDLSKVAKSFGFTVPPAVDLSVTETEFDKKLRHEQKLEEERYLKKLNDSNEKKKRVTIIKRVGKRKDVRKVSR